MFVGKFSLFHDIQLFRDNIFTFTKNDHMWQARVTIIFANTIFAKNAKFIAHEDLSLYLLVRQL